MYADLFANIDKMSGSARSFVTLTHIQHVLSLRYVIKYLQNIKISREVTKSKAESS